MGKEILNKEQREAVEFGGKHLLVLAGAGTGKTKTIIERAKYLVEHGVNASRIVILSFTRKSAREIASRIKMGLDNKILAKDITGQTFHSWCMGIIKNNPEIFAQSECTVLDEDDVRSCFKLLAGRNFKKNTGVRPEDISKVYSYVVNTLCSLSEAIRVKMFDNMPFESDANKSPEENEEHYKEALRKKIENIKPVFEKIIRAYMAYKAEHRYMDYDDILNVVSKALKRNEVIRNLIAGRYDHILVDEMQDTNPLQYELLSSFYEKCHLFCVGDDAQSIYAFRGADFKTIHSFTSLVEGSELCKLTMNYRSTQEILDLANWALAQSPLEYDKELTSNRGKGEMPEIIHWRDEWEEANDITDKILDSITTYGLKYADNMVLSRTVWGLRKVEAACIEKKIPYKVFGGIGIMQSKHIRDVVSPMRIVSNYKDEIAWSRYLQLWKGIGEVYSADIINEIIGESTLDECLSELDKLGLQKEICGTLYNLKDIQHDVPMSISRALETMTERLKEIYKDEWVWRKDDFSILKEVAASTGSVSEFIAEYVLDPKLDSYAKTHGKLEDCAILSTIHSAKGLEAANCYIVNASVTSYPTKRAMLNGDDAVEEERRCLYVALTRAKDRLYVYRDIASIHIEDTDVDKLYFFHNIPCELFKSVTINDERAGSDGECYSGEKVEIYTDFDFS